MFTAMIVWRGTCDVKQSWLFDWRWICWLPTFVWLTDDWCASLQPQRNRDNQLSVILVCSVICYMSGSMSWRKKVGMYGIDKCIKKCNSGSWRLLHLYLCFFIISFMYFFVLETYQIKPNLWDVYHNFSTFLFNDILVSGCQDSWW